MKRDLYEKLTCRVNKEALLKNEPFTVANIVELIGKEFPDYSNDKLHDLVEEILSNNDEILFKSHEGGYDLLFPIGVFFKGAEFCSTPSEEELKKGIFVLDDFFLVFAKSGITRSSFHLLNKELVAENIETTISMPLFRSKNQFSLLKDGKNSKSAKITVVNLGNFYKESGFCKGDTLIFRVEDYNRGVFSFRRKSVEERGKTHLIQEWCVKLSIAFREIFENFGAILECRNQMEELFLFNPDILRDPPISFDEFLKISPEIEICKKANGSFFSIKAIEESKNENSDGVVSVSSGRTGDLVEILEDIGLAVLPELINSYIKDAMFKKLTIEDVYERLLKFAPLNFADEAQRVYFDIMMEEKWEDISDKYNPSLDSVKGVFRERLLDNYDQILQIVLETEKKQILLSEIPEDEFKKFSAYLSSLSDLIISLDDEYSVFNEQNIKKIEELLQSFGEIKTIADKLLQGRN